MPDEIDKLLAEQDDEKPYNSADEGDVNKARAKAGRRRYDKLNAIKNIMAEKGQRRYIYNILLTCEIMRLSFISNEPQPGGGEFRDGKKFIGYQLLADIKEACPDMYDLMTQEAKIAKLPSLYPEIGFDR